MKAAVLGCNGYLGQHLVHYLVSEKRADVVGFDLHASYTGREAIAYRRLDITSSVDMGVIDEGFDAIYHFTGVTGTEISLERYKQFIEVNEIGLLNVLSRVREFKKIPKIIFPSTRLVYKGAKGQPLSEDSEKEFKTIYASSKFNGEKYLEMHKNMFGVDYTVFRLCVPYANLVAGALSYGTIGFFLGKARGGEDISLFGDGALRRTFTHVWDVCRQVVEVGAIPESSGRVLNIDGEDFSLKEAATLIAEKYDVGLRFLPWPDSALKIESGDTIFDGQNIRAMFPQTLTHSFEKWIKA